MTCKEAERWLDTDPNTIPNFDWVKIVVADHLKTCRACQPIYLKRLKNGIQLMIDAGAIPKEPEPESKLLVSH